jgi:hypothetical protein
LGGLLTNKKHVSYAKLVEFFKNSIKNGIKPHFIEEKAEYLQKFDRFFGVGLEK